MPGSTDAEAPPALSLVELPCPSCGEVLKHRIVHLKGGGTAGRGPRGPLEGVARCLRCRTSHPFSLAPRPYHRVRAIVSDGPSSTSHLLSFPREFRFVVGDTLRIAERPVRIARIEGREGRNLPRGVPEDVVALWTVPDDVLHLRVSVVEGSRTVPYRVDLEAEAIVHVGDRLTSEEEVLEIIGLRGRGQTFREMGDELPAREVQRIYGRRAERPPGGRSAWTRSRASPRS